MKKKLINRQLVLYTPNYAVEPFGVVFDSSLKKFKGMDSRAVAELFDRQPAEDSETRIFYVNCKVTNKEFLHVLNSGMEIVTIRQERSYAAWAKKKHQRNKTPKVDC